MAGPMLDTARTVTAATRARGVTRRSIDTGPHARAVLSRSPPSVTTSSPTANPLLIATSSTPESPAVTGRSETTCCGLTT